jgi:hypothetical protein
MNLFKNARSLETTVQVLVEKKELKEEYQAEQVDVGFREEVIAELITLGFAPHVAANMTHTPAKLMAKAKEIEYI